MSWKVLRGDCREVMAGLDADSVDAIVCDPPYGLEFMGKEWDRLRSRDGTKWVGDPESPISDESDTPHHRARIKQQSVRPLCQRCGKGGSGAWGRCECLEPLIVRPSFSTEQQEWHLGWTIEAFRVLKPGGHLLAFGGTRTFHRMTCAIEDAGFEIRDCLSWMYGSGFPKSMDVSKAIDKAAGAEREVLGETTARMPQAQAAGWGNTTVDEWRDAHKGNAPMPITAPATPEAEQWDGWGTALKPAWEPIVMARKPLIGTVAANVVAHGTGALNIDGSRLGTIGDSPGSTPPSSVDGARGSMAGPMDRVAYDNSKGRWPANVVLTHHQDCNGECTGDCPVRLLDEQTGTLTSGMPTVRGRSAGDREGNTSAAFGSENRLARTPIVGYGDSGGASRFFYCGKAADRDEGLPSTMTNDHPTVKPIDVMRWLVKLVTPPDGLVLDPFTGSGSTGVAALREGFRFVGIERDGHYADIAEARIRNAAAVGYQGSLL